MHLKKLDISKNSLKEFEGCPNQLQILNLSFNKLESIVCSESLIRLELQNNNFLNVPLGVLTLYKLEYLNIEMNPIKKLDARLSIL